MTADLSSARAPITGHTQLAAVIGSPIAHSISPAIHNAAFAACSLDWVYLAFEVGDGEAGAALDAVRTLGIRGLSVTMPHKTAVAAAVDELTDAARELQAVNCVVNRDGWLVGDNTDGAGFLDAFRYDTGGDVAGQVCGVIGGGGAARAVVRALAQAGAAEVVVVNRDAGRAAAAAALAASCGRVGVAADLQGCAIVINATPVGMAGAHQSDLPVPAAVLRPGQIVVDLVYNPLQTALMATARARGLEAHNGLGMLVFQAGHAFGQWTGENPPIDAMYSAARRGVAPAIS
jgi:shikimate dehydrogenase